MQNKKIILLASDCESSKWLYNAIKKDFNVEMVIIETPLSKKILFKRRIKKIGLLKVLGQTLFSLVIVPILKQLSKKQRNLLINKYQLIDTDFDGYCTKKVLSINNNECKELLQKIEPDIVLVNGTRIISKKILDSTKAIFVNMHVGITPWYRGSHGGYWALYNNDAKNFGTTIHLIDTGVDTGAIIEQAFTVPHKADNFTTYPIVQAAIGINTLTKVLPKIISNNFQVVQNTEKGEMYYQPTLWEYFTNKTK